MSELELSVHAATGQEPQDQLKSNTYWFHIFQAMVDREHAKLGPYAFAVYCVKNNKSSNHLIPSTNMAGTYRY